jgi:hypothetical protein
MIWQRSRVAWVAKMFPAKPLLGEVRQVAAVVDVRVGEDHHVDVLRIEVREAAVHLVGLLARSLIEPAIEQDALAVDLKQMLRAGGGAGGTAEFEFHELCVWGFWRGTNSFICVNLRSSAVEYLPK